MSILVRFLTIMCGENGEPLFHGATVSLADFQCNHLVFIDSVISDVTISANVDLSDWGAMVWVLMPTLDGRSGLWVVLKEFVLIDGSNVSDTM